jgi:hypothetical protein
MENKNLINEAKLDLQKILLNMKYDNKVTLSENKKNIKEIELPKKLITEGNWSWKSDEVYQNDDTKEMLYCCNQSSYCRSALNTCVSTCKIQTPECKDARKSIAEKRKKNDERKNWFKTILDDNESYWKTLRNKLEAQKSLIPYIKESNSDSSGNQYYWGMFVVRRYKGPFISYGTGNTFVGANLDKKYSGTDLDKTIVTISQGTDKGSSMTLLGFIQKYSSSNIKKDEKKEKVIDYTPDNNKQKNNNKTNNRSSGYKECTRTYSYGCISDQIGEAQQCLKDQGLYVYRVDNKFGGKTLTAIKNKLGKSTFTDSDLPTICKSDKGGGGGNQNDFDQDFSEKEKSTDTTWTGEVY